MIRVFSDHVLAALATVKFYRDGDNDGVPFLSDGYVGWACGFFFANSFLGHWGEFVVDLFQAVCSETNLNLEFRYGDVLDQKFQHSAAFFWI